MIHNDDLSVHTEDLEVLISYILSMIIAFRDYVDISVAVATPRGLVVPVLRNVESMDYPRIELALNGLAAKARDGTDMMLITSYHALTFL
jgi:pyruvate/2-oxoglutarate dehydrogenase complex dihydrolipoamide acyltransferase (E2) component